MGVTRYPLEGATYSEAVSFTGPGRWVHVSGQVALGQDGGLIDGGVREQAICTLDHLERALARAAASLADVVKITVYLKDLSDYPAFSEVRGERFGETLPASAAVAVADLLFGAAVELEALAFVAEARADPTV
jgi:2-iminobutanoate/2-iminopropanoate deaminase